MDPIAIKQIGERRLEDLRRDASMASLARQAGAGQGASRRRRHAGQAMRRRLGKALVKTGVRLMEAEPDRAPA